MVAVRNSVIDDIRNAPQTANCRWWVAYCRGGYDRKVADGLRLLGALALWITEPRSMQYRQSGGRPGLQTQTSETPRFPGYVFFNGTHDHRAAVRGLGAMEVIHVNQQEKLARELVNAMKAFEREPHAKIVNLRRGQRVRINGGPLKGQEGDYIASLPGRVYVNVGILGRAVELEVSPEFIQPF